jgi:hypothetical protein
LEYIENDTVRTRVTDASGARLPVDVRPKDWIHQ